MALVFESSQRSDPLIMEHFGELRLPATGEPLPTEHCLMPKRANEPGLEIADSCGLRLVARLAMPPRSLPASGLQHLGQRRRPRPAVQSPVPQDLRAANPMLGATFPMIQTSAAGAGDFRNELNPARCRTAFRLPVDSHSSLSILSFSIVYFSFISHFDPDAIH